MTAAGDQEWSAEYSTTPFSLSGPLKKSVGDPRASQIPIPPPPGFPAPTFDFASARERWERQREELAGLITHVDGTVRVRSNGECVEHTSATRMPLLFGTVWSVPLIRLPDDAEQTLPRQWADTTGTFKVQARLVDRTAAEVRLIRMDNGQTISVPIERWGPVDREIIRTFAPLRTPEK